MPGMRTQFARSVRVNRARLRKTSSNSPPLTRNPIESITRKTKKKYHRTTNRSHGVPTTRNASKQKTVVSRPSR